MEVDQLRKDMKYVRQEIKALVSDLLADYPGTSIDYGSIWVTGKKGNKKVKVRLDIKV